MKINLFAILILMSGCMEGLPEETPPDAAVPPSEPDACPTPMDDATVVNTVDADVVLVPDATPTSPDAMVQATDASVPPAPDATPVTPDAAPVPAVDASCPPPPPAPTISFTATSWTITSGASSTLNWTTTNASMCTISGGLFGGGTSFAPNWNVTVSPTTTTNYWIVCTGPGGMVSSSGTMFVTPAPECVSDSDCADSYSWTGDACSGGTCVNWPIDCGGMQVRPSATALSCQFWSGFGTAEPAPSLGVFVVSSLPVGAAGGDWKATPTSACSVKCYNSAGAEVLLDTQTEWNGVTFLRQLITGLLKGTFDGHNTY